MYGDRHGYPPFADADRYRLQRRRRRTGLYQFMTPDRYRPGDEIRLHDIFLALKEHTTSTGLPHIHHSRGPIKKGWWILITLGALGGLIFNLYQLCTNYFNYDVNVAISMLHRSELNFPSVTICNLNPVRQSALYNLNNPGGSTTPTPASHRRRKRAAGAGADTSTPATGESSVDDKCCCTCCFPSSDVARIYEYCACNSSVYPYDPSACPSSSLSSSSSLIRATTTRWLNPTTTTQPPTTTQTMINSLPPDATTTKMMTTTTEPKAATTTTIPMMTTTLTTTPEVVDDETSENQEQDLIEMLAALPVKEKVALGFSEKDLILDCKFEGADCPKGSTFASFFNEILGNCYIFNSEWANFTQVAKSKKTGRRHGLHLILNVNQDEYVSIGDDTAGIRLVVSNLLRMPFPEDEGLALNPGQSTSIGLRQVTMQRLPQPYGSCVDPTIPNKKRNVYEELYPGVQYSTLACMRTCYQSNVISSCECGDASLPLIGSAFGFPPSRGVAVPPCSHRNQTQQSCKEAIGIKYNNNELKCDCPDSCNDTEFTTTLSIGQWPSNVQKGDILEQLSSLVTFSLNDSSGYKDNLIKVEIFYEEFDFELMQEVAAYQLAKFISDLGGVVGLWLGMSVLTACEFFEFGLDITLFGIGQFIQYKKGKNSSNSSSNGAKHVNVLPQGQAPYVPPIEGQAPYTPPKEPPYTPPPPTDRPSTASSVGIGVVNQMEMSAVA